MHACRCSEAYLEYDKIMLVCKTEIDENPNWKPNYVDLPEVFKNTYRWDLEKQN